ncbi:hypothetical protein EJB05_11889, partial [Eragrostis curvula]
MAVGAIPESMDYWKAGEIDEEYIAELRSAGWISDFVITKENKGSMCFSFDTPKSRLFTTLCECWLGTAPSLDLWRVYHKPRYYSSGLVGCVSFNIRKNSSYIPCKGLLPFHQGWNKSVPVMDERLKRMTAKVSELVALGLRGEHVTEEYVRKCFFPLQEREPLAMFGVGSRNPRWLPDEVAEIPEDVVAQRVRIILESDLEPKPEGFPLSYSASNPAEKDEFGPDPSKWGAKSTMILDSSSGEKEPRESPKKSSAEAFADDVLTSPDGQNSGADLQSLEEKVTNIKATLMSDSSPKSPSPPKTRLPPKTRSSSKPGSSTGVTHPKGKRNAGVKRPRVLAAGSGDVVATAAPSVVLSSGSSPGPDMLNEIIADVQAAEAWTLETCKSYGSKVRDLQLENEQLRLKLLKAGPSPALVEKDTKISELEVALAGATKALADLKTAHASEVKTLQDANIALTTSVEGLKNKSKVMEEKLETMTKDVQLLQQHISTLEADKGKLKCDAAQRDALMEQTHDSADAFVTSLKLILEDAPAEEEAAEDEGPGEDQ